MRTNVCLLAASAFMLPLGAPAATLHVPGDHPTIWEAIDAAVSGDSVLVGPGTWTDTDTRILQLGSAWQTITSCGFLKGGLTVIGEAGAEGTVVDAGGGAPPGFVDTFILANQAEGEIVLEGLTVTGAGVNGTAIFATQSPTLTVRHCRFTDNEPGDGGFVIRVHNTDLLMEDTESSSNVAHSCLSIVESSIEVVRCRFEGNVGTAIRGGGGGGVGDHPGLCVHRQPARVHRWSTGLRGSGHRGEKPLCSECPDRWR